MYDPKQRLLTLALDHSREKCERSLSTFIRQAWHVLEPSTPFCSNWHIDYIAEHLELVTAGELTRLIIKMPPRMTKSHTCTIFWPTWEWIHKPANRWLFWSYDASLSTEHSLKRRNLISSEWYQDRWGKQYRLRGDQNVKTHFENDRTGAMQAVTAATGKGADRIVIDDPHDAKDQDNAEAIKRDVEVYRSSVANRLNDAKRGAKVLVCHRLHEADLTAWIEKNELDRWTKISLTATAERKEYFIFPRSKVRIEREEGQLLQPGRFDKHYLANQRVILGPYRYAGQYQQRPQAAEGGIFKRSWWVYKPKSEWPESFEYLVQVWDTAQRKGKENAYSVCVTFGWRRPYIYIADVLRRQMEWPELRRTAIQHYLKWQPRLLLVEDASSGMSLIDDLKTISDPVLPIVPVKADHDKIARANAATGLVEAGRIILPESAEWVYDFVEELAKAGPTAEYMDQTDAFSHGIAWFKKREMGNYFLEWMKGQVHEQARKEMEENLRRGP